MKQDKGIELIVHTEIRPGGKAGYRYFRCRFTFTNTRESLRVGGMGGDDGNGLPRQLGLEWEQVYAANETLAARDWDQHDKYFPDDCWEHEALPRLEAMLARARGQAVPV